MRNPFTAGERIEMIRSSIDADNEIEISRIFIIPVPDTNVHALWASQINLLVPKYQIVFSNDPLTSILFRERGIRVVRARLHTRRLLSATEIRSRFVKGGRWKRLVTTGTLKVMEEVGGVERIKALSARKTNESHINR
jgi:nicotinamide-nucleotide adenylyltransferase